MKVKKDGFGWAVTLLIAIILNAIGMLDRPVLALADEKKTFVLVHGAWVGEWYWDPVIEPLTADGHKVFAVSLSGHGKKSELGGKEIGSQEHIDDIVRVIRENKLRDIVLVAHSYGGRPATGAWDLARDVIDHVVYVEAVAPLAEDGTVIPSDSKSLSYLMIIQPDVVDTGMFPVPVTLAKSLQARSMPHSIKSLYAEITLENGPLPVTTKRTFVVGKSTTKGLFRAYAERLRESGKWSIVELDIEHNFHDTGAQALANFLARLP